MQIQHCIRYTSALILVMVLIGASQTSFAQARLDSDPPGSCTYGTVSGALAAASAGDTVLVAPGIYPGSALGPFSTSVTVVSATDGTCTVPAATRGGVVFDYASFPSSSVPATANVTLRHLILQNGGGTSFGALLRVSGTLTLDDTLLKDSMSLVAGGCVWGAVSSDIHVLNNSRLENCDSTSGGAIYSDGNITIENSRLTDNTASSEGGAISMPLLLGGTLTVRDSSIDNNSSTNGGGIHSQSYVLLESGADITKNDAVNGAGIYGYGMVAQLSGDAAVTWNTATNHGGGLLNYGGSITIVDDSRVSFNTATNNGGGILVQGTTPTLILENNARIVGNEALNSAGIFLSGGVFEARDRVLIHKNIATINGGGLTLSQTPSTAAVYSIEDNVEISENEAELGGGISARFARIHISDDVSIHDNTVVSSGAGLYAKDTEVVLSGAVQVHSNTAGQYGGGLCGVDESIFVLDGDVEVYGNEATTFNGGGVSVDGGHVTTVGNVKVRNNDAGGFGGGIFAQNAYLYQGPNARLTDNTSEVGAGAALLGQVPLTNTILGTVSNNTAGSWGGGVYLDRDSNGVALTMAGTTVVDNNRACHGGGLYLGLGEVHAEGSTFSNNIADKGQEPCFGGGMYIKHGSISLKQGLIVSNTARRGGGVHMEGNSTPLRGVASFVNTYIHNNTAVNRGGGVNIAFKADFNMSSNYMFCNPFGLAADQYCSEIRGNKTTGSGSNVGGGGVRMDDESVTATIVGTALLDNDSNSGAAFDQLAGVGQLESCLVARNALNTQSDAVHLKSGDLDIYNTTLASNACAVRMSNSTSPFPSKLSMSESIVYGNATSIFWAASSGPNTMVLTDDLVEHTPPTAASVSNVILGPHSYNTAHPRGPYHLTASSAAVDGSASWSLRDLDGVSHNLGAGLDWGAFEDF